MAEKKEQGPFPELEAMLNKKFGDDTTVPSLISLVRCAETVERFEDMSVFVKRVIKLRLAEMENMSDDDIKDKKFLNTEDRNLFSVAYKHVVSQRRQSWRSLCSEEESTDDKELLKNYQAAVADDIKVACNEVQGLLTAILTTTKKIEKAAGPDGEKQTSDDRIFYLKMKGDYYRYLREVYTTEDKYKTECENAYKEAWELAEKTLEATNPTRLGLALNYSVCYYEILSEPEKACELAKKAFDAAIEKLDSLSDASYKDSTLIMQLLRDNLTLWSAENEDPEAQK